MTAPKHDSLGASQRRGPVPREFLGFWPLAAVLIMAVNDHLLKPAFPGLVTGKISDVAIAFFFPIYVATGLAALTGLAPRARLAVGSALTALVFFALELSPAAARFYGEALTPLGRALGFAEIRTMADPSDLLALPAIGLAWVYVFRGVPRTSNERTST